MQGNPRTNKASPMGKALTAFTLAVFIWMTGTSAKAVTFPAQNFVINIPPGWETVTPTPAGALIVARTPDRSKVVVVDATKVTVFELPSAVASELAGAKKNYIARGLKTDPEQSLTVNGVPFRYFVGHPAPDGSSAIYAAVAGEELYGLVLLMKNGDASTDPELQTVVQSFRLISYRVSPDIANSRSAAYKMGYQQGQLAGAFLIVLVPIIFVLIVRFVIFKPKTTSIEQAPPPLPPQTSLNKDEESQQ